MKRLLSVLALTLISGSAAFADPEVKGWNTNDSMGCMMLRECTDHVKEVTSIKDIKRAYPDSDYSVIGPEFNDIVSSLNEVGVKVFLGNSKYFPRTNRGIYHTVGNNFFLNAAYMSRPHTLMSVTRHEAWHAVQDCMAGTIDNSFIAIVKPEEEVPYYWKEIAERTYPKSAVAWEQEAKWAGSTEGMTRDALKACAKGNMWEHPLYDPTPMTEEWLVENGFIK